MCCACVSSGDLSDFLVFRIAGLASIRSIPIEGQIVLIPFWESRIVLETLLTRVGRLLRGGLLLVKIGFPFQESAKEASTGILNLAGLKTEVKSVNGLQTISPHPSIVA